MAESVKVAVRVRPFNGREMERNAKLIIGMDGNTTTIQDPDEPNEDPRKFAFDYSYWSHDSYDEDPETGYLSDSGSGKYTDQAKVFDDLGRDVLKNAWLGYNCSLFAYGQTGSGKSYSVVGYGQNKGIVPQFCDNIFKEIRAKEESEEFDRANDEFSVQVSMIEIYNEQVKDLLNVKSYKKGGLRVRQSKDGGFEVQNLRYADVTSYAEIDALIEQGTSARTIAATNMNATSSRAHTVVTIYFKQKSINKELNKSMTKTARIALVDLAGSERAESTGATGDRLKEGAAINLSLSALGNVIKALADESEGKRVVVPFRDSVLTKLLKTALSGNSKTMLVAALSPADINYDETMSTLRFADRAKAIKTKAVVNESPTDKLIRELREEIEALRKGGATATAGGKVSAEDKEKMDAMREELEANEREMAKMRQTWEEKMATHEEEANRRLDREREKNEMKKTTPHLWNLNEDPALTGMVVYFCPEKETPTTLGSAEGQDVVLSGLGMKQNHASIMNPNNDTITIKPIGGPVTINGKEIKKEGQELNHNDRVLFSNGHLYAFHHPRDAYDELNAASLPNFNDAQKEIAKEKGFDMTTTGKTAEDLQLMEDLVKILPMVDEVNGIAQELNKKNFYEIVCICANTLGDLNSKATDVYIKCTNLIDQTEFLFDSDSFTARKFKMQEIYQNFQNYKNDKSRWDVDKSNDPFYDNPATTPVTVGNFFIILEALAYLVNMEDQLQINNYQGMLAGNAAVDVFPVDSSGNVVGDAYVTDPSELVGNPMGFGVRVNQIQGVHQRFMNLLLELNLGKAHGGDKPRVEKSPKCKGTGSFKTKYTVKVEWKSVTQDNVNYLLHEGIFATVKANQRPNSQGKAQRDKLSCKELVKRHRNMDPSARNSHWHSENAKNSDHSLKEIVSRASASTKRRLSQTLELRANKAETTVEFQENKISKVRQLCSLATRSGRKTVPMEMVLNALDDVTFSLPSKLSEEDIPTREVVKEVEVIKEVIREVPGPAQGCCVLM